MADKLKAHGADDAWAFESVRNLHPNCMNHIKKEFRSQFYSRYRVGPDLLASLHHGQAEVDHE